MPASLGYDQGALCRVLNAFILAVGQEPCVVSPSMPIRTPKDHCSVHETHRQKTLCAPNCIQTTSTSSRRASPRFQRRDNHRNCSVNIGEVSGRCKSRRSTPSQQYRKQRRAYRSEAPLDTSSIETWDMVIFMQLVACSRLLWHGLHSQNISSTWQFYTS